MLLHVACGGRAGGWVGRTGALRVLYWWLETSMSRVLYCTVYSLSLCSCIGTVINAMRASACESQRCSTTESGWKEEIWINRNICTLLTNTNDFRCSRTTDKVHIIGDMTQRLWARLFDFINIWKLIDPATNMSLCWAWLPVCFLFVSHDNNRRV